MINSVIEAVSRALYSEFGCKIHMEEIEQGLEEPCFLISCLNPATKRYPGKRYFRQNPLAIQYFPESRSDLRRECGDVAERLMWCLEWVAMKDEDKPIRGTGMHYEIVDEVLHFFVNYDFFVYRPEDTEPMETLTERQRTKG